MEKERLEMDLDFDTPLTVERLQGLAEVVRTLADATRKTSTTSDVDYYVGTGAKKIVEAIEERIAMEREKWQTQKVEALKAAVLADAAAIEADAAPEREEISKLDSLPELPGDEPFVKEST